MGLTARVEGRARAISIRAGVRRAVKARHDDHVAGQAGRTTALDQPVALMRVEVVTSFTSARAREAQLKRWSRAKKLALIAGAPARLHELSRSHD